MPNWVHNTIKVKTSDFKDFCKDTLDKEGNFDFNKIAPLSKDLNILANDMYKKITQPYHVTFYADDIKFQEEHVDTFLSQFYNDKISQMDFVKLANSELCKATNKNVLAKWKEKYGEYQYHSNSYTDGTIDFGKNILYPELLAGYFNCQRYGYPSWYSAQIDTWGTKWNACETYVDEQSCVISFDTAWSMPEPIFIKLSEKYEFVVAFADEDIGSNYGLVRYSDGVEIPIITGWGVEVRNKSDRQRTAEAVACRFEDLDNIFWNDDEEDEVRDQEIEKEFEIASEKIKELF